MWHIIFISHPVLARGCCISARDPWYFILHENFRANIAEVFDICVIVTICHFCIILCEKKNNKNWCPCFFYHAEAFMFSYFSKHKVTLKFYLKIYTKRKQNAFFITCICTKQFQSNDYDGIVTSNVNLPTDEILKTCVKDVNKTTLSKSIELFVDDWMTIFE